ncbi:MAG: hypothetical protein AAGG44_01565 [Planctomycetota bacterium]
MFATQPQNTVAAFRAGDWVTVRQYSEIAESLDPDSCYRGIQFMPKMLAYTGHSFRLRRFANKLCAQTDDGIAIYGLDDAVILDVPRCGGEDHGGCQMGCELLWHTSWLTPGKQSQSEEASQCARLETPATLKMPVVDVKARLLSRLESACFQNAEGSNSASYRCQATSIRKQLHPLPPTRISQYYVDVFQNPNGVSRFLQFAKSLLLRKLGVLRDLYCDQKRTPSGNLGIQVGERVRVKSLEGIQTTLDAKGCNRGLWFDTPAMAPYCGQTMVVSRRITRMIDERTGKLVELKQPAIVLAEAACDGLHRRFCSRGSLLFWREVWLERPQKDSVSSTHV